MNPTVANPPVRKHQQANPTDRANQEQHTLREKEATLWDGTKIFYRAWLPNVTTDKAVILFHRGHEHSGRFLEIVEQLGLADFAIFAWDARGHGRSPGERGWAPSFGAMVRDMDSFVHWVSSHYEIPIENMAVVALSVSGVTASAWVHDYAPPIRAMVLASPSFRIKLYVPLAIPGLRLLQCVKKKSFVKSYVRSNMVTHDPEWARDYDEDPLLSRSIAVNILLGLHDASTRLMKDVEAIHTPTLLLSAGADWVVWNGVQDRFYKRLSSTVKQREHYEDFYHSIYHEKDRHLPIGHTRQFILDMFEDPPTRPDLTVSDKRGPSKETYNRLKQSLSRLSPRRLGYSITRGSMKTLGSLFSKGIRLGWKTGFDSGASLDYVYQNRSQGFTPFGRLIDRIYLNSPGWTGIRERRENLKTLLLEAIESLRKQNRPIRILDVAAGHGRYVLEAVRQAGGDDIAVHLRDSEPSNVDAAAAVARELGVENVTCEVGDAFDRESLTSIEPRPNLVIVSGLYELFPENDPIRDSLSGISAGIEEGGYLVYTNQPWHPQQEFIARVLDNREGKPWIMRCRSQAEMDQLVERVGFQKTGMLLDEDGIFTVGIAKKV
ncbi:MAG: bifunctional alpha/beta hydrolase/class I SAM-dependent methyltransferase [Planctomycetia bacterium]|jgi:alpha-beta hydrolase superfamily lysophospholipase